MKVQVIFLILSLAYFSNVSCNCGCLKCSKHLQVVSPPHLPYKVIYRGQLGQNLQSEDEYANPIYNGCNKPMSYQVQIPLLPPPKLLPMPNLDYNVAPIARMQCEPLYAYKYKVQVPLIPPPLSIPMTGLVAKPDRIVIPAPECPAYRGCEDLRKPYCNPIWPNRVYNPLPSEIVYDKPMSGPIVEKLCPSMISEIACDCRYGSRNKRRTKRDLPILKSSVNFIMGLLPNFIRFPIEQTLKTFVRHQKFTNNLYNKPHFVKKLGPKYVPKIKEVPPIKTSKTSFLKKLQKLNGGDHRKKRSLIMDDREIHFPFLRVTDVENDISSSEEEDDDEDIDSEEVQMKNQREEFLKPLNFEHMLPHNPLFYFLNAPIRFLHHFHKLGQQFFPVFRSVPHVFINSKRYLRDFKRLIKNDMLNFASDIIGDFDEFGKPNYFRPRRFRRSLNQSEKFEPYEPEYTLVFNEEPKEITRSKRYILKVVDEDEVEEFLREKLGGLMHDEHPKKKNKDNLKSTRRETQKKKSKDKENKKKLVVEKLSSKIIIDNNGRPFVEINGAKRPLFFNKKHQEEDKDQEKSEEKEKSENTSKEQDVQDMKEKINSLILQAKERIDQRQDFSQITQNEVLVQIIKDRINQILTEIQDLVNMDFDYYSTIHSDLCKLQNFKDFLVNDWKKVLLENKQNDMSSKIRILNDFKEMQVLKDKAVQDIAAALSKGSNFMTKKLIKMLVRLQKLQCIIYRVVEDFGEKIKMCTQFDVQKEIKYIDYLSGISFVDGRSKHDLEKDLRVERDTALQNEMTLMDHLRNLLDHCKDPHSLYEEAKLLWEFKNIDKLQKEAIKEMNEKISRGQKIRKELKILFDLLKQSENSEEKQKKLLDGTSSSHSHRPNESGHREVHYNHKGSRHNNNFIHKESNRHHSNRHNVRYDSTFPHKTIIEDKKPIKLVTNGYSLTAYKVADGFD